MAEEYLTAKELSSRIKYPVGSIKNLVCQKEFIKNKHYVKPTPRKILFIWSACEAWLLEIPQAHLLVIEILEKITNLTFLKLINYQNPRCA